MHTTYFTVDDVAMILSVHPTTVRRWIRSGSLRATHFGDRVVRISDADLDAFADQGSAA